MYVSHPVYNFFKTVTVSCVWLGPLSFILKFFPIKLSDACCLPMFDDGDADDHVPANDDNNDH